MEFQWDISARYADDAGHRKFTDEIYEHQYRLIAGAQWQPKAIGWTDLVIEKIPSKSSFHIDSFRWVIKSRVKTNELNLQSDGNGKMNGRLIQIEQSMNKVIDRPFSLPHRYSSHSGFEYCVNQTLSSWSPVENFFHLNRRRRWYRTRTVKKDLSIEERKVLFPRLTFN